MTTMTFTSEQFPFSELEVTQFDELIEISIARTNNGNSCVEAVQITIADAEQLIDELHKVIMNIEDDLKTKICK